MEEGKVMSVEGKIVFEFFRLQKEAKKFKLSLRQNGVNGFTLEGVSIREDGFPNVLTCTADTLDHVEGFLAGIRVAKECNLSTFRGE